MRLNIKSGLIIILFIFFPNFSSSQVYTPSNSIESKYLNFQHLDISNGLSQSTVSFIMQDKKGFLWFCTDDGLNRYDGYDFKIYRNDPNDPNSISNNVVLTAFEDHSGFLWFGTADGLNRYNPQNGHFINYKSNPDDSIRLSGNFVFSIYESTRKPGVLWVGTGGGLDKLILNDKGTPSSIIHYSYSSNKEPNCISNNTVIAITEDESGLLWIGTHDGLNRFNPENENFTWYKNDFQNPNSLSNNYIKGLCLDRSGALWIGTSNGLDKLMPEKINDISPSFLHYKNNPQNVNSLSNNHITSVFESRSGVIWVGTQNGLNKIVQKASDRYRPAFVRYYENIDDPNSLLDDWVFSIIEDRSGILWIGCHKGINKLSPKKNKFLPFRFQNNISKRLNNKSIFGISEDSNDILWIGTSEGLIRYEKKNGQIIHYENDPNDLHSLSSNKVRPVIKDKSGNLWIGTIAGGLNRFNRTNNKFIHYLNDPHNPSTIGSNTVLALYNDKGGNLWVGTFGGGLNKFDAKNDQFIRYLNDPADTNSLCDNRVRAICEDIFGDLWIGTNNGLDKFDISTKKFFHYKANSKNPNSLNNNIIFSLYGDKAGNLWIGTSGGGLNKLEIEKGKFSSYGAEEGLPNEVVYGILEDDRNNLWLSTNKGLSRFNPRTEKLYNYDVSDGLQGNEFDVGACYKSKSGEMFFGGVDGISAFYPDNIKESTFIPPIVITSFLKFNKEVSLNKSISEMDQMELSYKDYVFSFEFASLDFQAPEKNRYAYKMEGLDEKWTYTTADKRFATYTTLPAGDYVFKVKGTNSDGIWNENGTVLKIRITPPFWQTWWFKSLSAIVLIALIVILYKYRIKKIEEKKRLLEIQVKERTEAAQKIQEALSEVEKLKNELEAENVYLQDEIKLTHNFESIISTSESFKKILYKVEQVSGTDAIVLILGESGTGKELLARAIHGLSNRKNKPLIKVNCATLPSNLIESELFGHEKGAFTGAFSRKIGRFELANGGTIFLDEIGELPLELQTKLLRVLQENEFERLGGTTPIQVDVRVIAATNRDLETALKQGTFREDLYYRLNVFPIKVPPLRERKEDISVLVNHFINKHGKKIGKKIESISPKLMNKLIEYDWPGNVRELENVIERAIIISPENNLKFEDSFFKNKENANNGNHKTLNEVERKYITEVLESTNWRVSGPNGAAKILGLAPSTLEFRMKKLNIHRK